MCAYIRLHMYNGHLWPTTAARSAPPSTTTKTQTTTTAQCSKPNARSQYICICICISLSPSIFFIYIYIYINKLVGLGIYTGMNILQINSWDSLPSTTFELLFFLSNFEKSTLTSRNIHTCQSCWLHSRFSFSA